MFCGRGASHCKHSAVGQKCEASYISGGAPKWRQYLALLAQEARLTDGEADVQSHRKSKASYLRTFADGDEVAESWTLLPKPGNGRVQQTLLLPLLTPFPRMNLLLPFILKQLLESSERLLKDKGRACVEGDGFHPVTHGCPARVSHLRQIATHVRLTHAQEAIHKLSVKPL